MPSPCRTLLLIPLLFAAIGPASSSAELSVGTGPVPAWVEPHTGAVEAHLSNMDAPVGSHWLLLDVQENTIQGEIYRHHSLRLLNREAVESLSDIMVDFNPSYQTLTFHFITIHRDGRRMDKHHDHEIRAVQRERLMDWGIYDGTATAVVNLHDVRPGDILEYAYTTKGANPLLANHVTLGFIQQADFPIQEIRFRVVVDSERPLYTRAHNGAEEPAREFGPYGLEYRWQGQGILPLPVDNNVPPWFDPHARFSISSFADWEAVADWARSLYALDDGDLAAAARLAETAIPGRDLHERILAAIRFVQDEVRYLGLSEGLWALQPRKPQVCLQQRFGDCKDKSLLLVALLRHLGVVAYPVLVSSIRGCHLADDIPSPFSFDHCVVGLELPSGTVYLDPTCALQGGGIENRFFPDFGQGLPIKEGGGGLKTLPAPPPLKIEVDERYVVEATGQGDARFNVHTRYFGRMADMRREILATNSVEGISQNNIQFYSQAWPGIEELAQLEVRDEDREGDNILEIREFYHINEVWQSSDTGSTPKHIEIYPLEMKSLVRMAPSPARTMPYHAGEPVDFHHRATIEMPRQWDVVLQPIHLAGAGVSFDHSVRNEGSVVLCEYHYVRDVQVILAEETISFVSLHNTMLQALGVYLFDVEEKRFALSPMAALLVLLSLSGGTFATVAIWKRYDPEPLALVADPPGIAGWLYLVAMGVTLRPLFLLVGLLSELSLLDQSTWDMADNGLIAISALTWNALLALELTGNIISLAFSILLLVLFIQRRSSLRRVFITYMVSVSVFVTLDSIAAHAALGALADKGMYRETVGSWLTTLIWVPYFLVSRRVRETFVNRIGSSSAITPGRSVSDPPAAP